MAVPSEVGSESNAICMDMATTAGSRGCEKSGGVIVVCICVAGSEGSVGSGGGAGTREAKVWAMGLSFVVKCEYCWGSARTGGAGKISCIEDMLRGVDHGARRKELAEVAEDE